MNYIILEEKLLKSFKIFNYYLKKKFIVIDSIYIKKIVRKI